MHIKALASWRRSCHASLIDINLHSLVCLISDCLQPTKFPWLPSMSLHLQRCPTALCVWLTGTWRAGARKRTAARSCRASERAAVGDACSHRRHSTAHHHIHPRPDGHTAHAARHGGLTPARRDGARLDQLRLVRRWPTHQHFDLAWLSLTYFLTPSFFGDWHVPKQTDCKSVWKQWLTVSSWSAGEVTSC